MNRIMVIGCCGAGKSTFSRKLKSILDLDLIHLDQHYWRPNWKESNKDEWTETVKKMADKENWIIDGNYGGTIDIRIKRAETIIYLNHSTFRCFTRVIRRVFKYWGKVRPDMPSGCTERFDLEFLHYVLTFKMRKAKNILEKLKQVEMKKNIFILNNDKETGQFLENLKTEDKFLKYSEH